MIRRIIFFTLAGILVASCCQHPKGEEVSKTESWENLKRDLTFYITNDLGRNGYYDQKTIAELMGEMALVLSPECVIAAGDVHHFEGVISTDDPLWMTNYELIYKHPELMIAWYPILGNHEYRGNTEAVLDYAKVSRRWEMENRYYTKVYVEDSFSIRFVLIDTSPIIDKYREQSDVYPDACKQSRDVQLAWLDSVLTVGEDNDWVVVVGHHPIYAETPKDENERADMQKYVDPILRAHNVDMYVCGHIHNFQHIRMEGNGIDYIVNSSGSLARKVNEIEGTQYCSPLSGFSVVSVDADELNLHFIDAEGDVIYSIRRTK